MQGSVSSLKLYSSTEDVAVSSGCDGSLCVWNLVDSGHILYGKIMVSFICSAVNLCHVLRSGEKLNHN